MVARKFSSRIALTIIVLLSTSPAFALGDGNRNLLLITAMCITPILFVFRPIIYPKIFFPLIIFILLIILCPMLNHPESVRWSTILFGILFCMFFIYYDATLKKSNVTIVRYQNIIKYLIYAYCIVLLIQQFCVLTGLPIFNISINYNPLDKWKLNSLTSEPSHSACFLGLLMFSYNLLYIIRKGKKPSFLIAFRENKSVWIAFIWSQITMVSASAMLYLFLVLFYFVDRRTILLISGGGLVLWAFAFEKGFTPVVRSTILFQAALTLDEENMMNADLSGSLRIVPSIISLKEINPTTSDGWFGKGIDFSKTFMSDRILGVDEGYSGGGLSRFALEYGLLPFFLFMSFSFWLCFDKRAPLISFFFWFLLVFLGSPNMQLTWAAIVLLYSNKIITRRQRLQSR